MEKLEDTLLPMDVVAEGVAVPPAEPPRPAVLRMRAQLVWCCQDKRKLLQTIDARVSVNELCPRGNNNKSYLLSIIPCLLLSVFFML
jgi:hypothetical protein